MRRRSRSPHPGVLLVLLVDDLDSLVARVPADHRTELLDRLGGLLWSRPLYARARHTLSLPQRIVGELQSVVALAPARIMLRHASRQDLGSVAATGSAFIELRLYGGGRWLASYLQVGEAGTPETARPAGPAGGARHGRAAARRQFPRCRTCRSAGRRRPHRGSLVAVPELLPALEGTARVAVVGDVDEWQSRWGALAALRPRPRSC